jgi:outer membrane protein assembly factor BamB
MISACPSTRNYTGLTLLLALLVLSGCSTVEGWFGKTNEVKPAALTEFKQAAKFEVRWHAELGDSKLNPLQPALIGDAVYGVSGKGVMTRLDRASGKQVWRIETGMAVSGGVGSGEGLVLLGSEKGDVLAYGEDGKLRWKSKVSSEVLSVPQVANGVVIVRSGDGRISGLSVADGAQMWIYEHSTPALVVRSHAGVTIQRDVAFAGFAGGKLAALNIKDGLLLWETTVSQPRGNTELERISDITSNPVADDEQLCAIAFQGRVACYDAAQGNALWSREISSNKGMALLRKNIYISDANSSIIALDKASGSTLWKNEQMLLRDTTMPCASGDFVIVGDYEGYLHGLSSDDGRFVARIKLDGSAIQSAPLQMDDGLLVQTRSGGLYSIVVR